MAAMAFSAWLLASAGDRQAELASGLKELSPDGVRSIIIYAAKLEEANPKLAETCKACGFNEAIVYFSSRRNIDYAGLIASFKGEGLRIGALCSDDAALVFHPSKAGEAARRAAEFEFDFLAIDVEPYLLKNSKGNLPKRASFAWDGSDGDRQALLQGTFSVLDAAKGAQRELLYFYGPTLLKIPEASPKLFLQHAEVVALMDYKEGLDSISRCAVDFASAAQSGKERLRLCLNVKAGSRSPALGQGGWRSFLEELKAVKPAAANYGGICLYDLEGLDGLLAMPE